MTTASSTQPSGPLPRRVFDAHHRLAIATAAAAIAGFLLQGRVGGPTLIVAIWNVFGGVSLCLMWAVILTQDPFEMRRAVRLQDSSRTFLFVVVVVAAVASLLAVGMMLGEAKSLPASRLGGPRDPVGCHGGGLGGALVHTVFALRYAHHYYEGAADGARDSVTGGLIFPEEANPDFLDFTYFSFVVGMTCQVSDVQISNRALRRTCLCQGIISFAFNTAILALVINIVAGML